MLYLKNHNSNFSNRIRPKVSWSVKNSSIIFNFEYENYLNFYVSDKFKEDYKENWGLWDFDVAEVFIKKEGEHYLEIQCSPLGQIFALIIKKPREEFFIPQSLTSTGKVLSRDPLKIQFIIDGSDIPGAGNKLYGNCYSCLGHDKRLFYGINLNSEDICDFHKPSLFIEFTKE